MSGTACLTRLPCTRALLSRAILFMFIVIQVRAFLYEHDRLQQAGAGRARWLFGARVFWPGLAHRLAGGCLGPGCEARGARGPAPLRYASAPRCAPGPRRARQGSLLHQTHSMPPASAWLDSLCTALQQSGLPFRGSPAQPGACSGIP